VDGSCIERREPDRAIGPAAESSALIEEAPSGFLPRSFKNAAGTRAYKLYVPSTHRGEPSPLIVMLHACTQSVDDFSRGTGMNVLAEEQTFLVAYPEQSIDANASKCWNWFNRRDQQRDLGEPSIIAGITRAITQEYAVDPKRVYIAGLSAGGAEAAVLAATYPDIYAALGVHSGVVYGLANDSASALAAMNGGSGEVRTNGSARPGDHERRVPTIVFHGDRDTTVHPRNADRFAAHVPATDCAKHVESGRVPGGRAFTRTTYTDASGQDVLELWLIHGAGHAWSGGSSAGSFTDPQGPDASREMVRFFLGHRLRE
jgi:poly(hydroxyalkanoate) depolymerase family esterase